MISGNGLWGLRNSEDGVGLVGKVRGMRQFCSAMGIPVSERHLLGNPDYSREREE